MNQDNHFCNQIKVATMKNMGSAVHPIVAWKWSTHYASLSTIYKAKQSHVTMFVAYAMVCL